MASRILVVDDEDMLVEFLVRALVAEGYEVDSAFDGAEAEEKALVNNYDCIILDVIMPKKNGLDVCRSLRAHGIKSHILILSSKNEEVDKVSGLDAGADDYMIKPFGFYELSARLRALERRPKDKLNQKLTFGNVELDIAKKLLNIDGRAVEIRRREIGLLHFLMSNPSETISRDDLLEKVWGINSPWAASNRVEVCATHLRKTLEQAGGNITIEGRRGLGYRVIAI